MRWFQILACSLGSAALIGVGANAAMGQAAPVKARDTKGATHLMLPPVPKALLPESFAGWVAEGAPKNVTDAALADTANAAALKEYDFTDGALGSYKREGETLSLRALRFHDASGAYGAYSFYRQNGWPKEDIGVGRYFKPQPRALLAGRYGRGCDISPTSARCPRLSCASWPASCPPRKEPER